MSIEDTLARMPARELILLHWKLKWTRQQAREKQIAPTGDWLTWGVRAGRGFGKTLTGANWMGIECASDNNSIGHVIAPTHDDVRHTCFEGPAGLYNVIPPALIVDSDRTLPMIKLWNGSVIRGFSAEKPERLRGPQCHRGWLDEIASWRGPQNVWDMYKFGLRLGTQTRTLWTSTLKPTPFIRWLLKNTDCMVSGSTYENKANLAPSFFKEMAKYEGTAIGRQELYGELLDAEDNGFIKRSQWCLWPAKDALPKFAFVLLSLDTAFTEDTFDPKTQTGDPTACTTWGVFEHDNKTNFMLLDAWEDHLGFPALMERVKKERLSEYGAADHSLLEFKEPRYGRPLIGSNKGKGRSIDMILIEDKGSGISLRQQLANENILTVPYNPGRMDKLSRLHAVSPVFANGRVWAVESNQRPGELRSWAEPVASQVCTYVGEGSLEHDDLMDTTTQALKYLADRFLGALSPAPKTAQQLLEDAVSMHTPRRDPVYG